MLLLMPQDSPAEPQSINTALQPKNSIVSKPETSLALVMPEKSYMRRCWESARELWGGHPKLELSAGFIGAIATVISIVLYMGATLTGILSAILGACIGFLTGLLFIFFYYLISSPRNVDMKIREELAAARLEIETVKANAQSEIEKSRAEIAEIYKHKLIFEIDERDTRIRLEETESAIRVYTNIKLRFENLSDHPISVKRFDVSLHRRGIEGKRSHEDIDTNIYLLRFSSEGVSIDRNKLEGLTINGHQLSPFYLIEVVLDVHDEERIKTSEDFDVVTYLCVTMETSGYQPEFTGELFPHWSQALKAEGSRWVMVRNAPSIRFYSRRLDQV